MATEIFTNLASTTVSSGGTTAPSGGTVESWTVVSSTPFPAASTGVSQFHVSDPAHPTELVLVTNVSGTTWTVTRGSESTTPIAHSAGFTINQVVTAGALGIFEQNSMTSLGDTEYGGAAGAVTRLAGNTTVTKNFLAQTGNGAVSAAPIWGTIAAGDMPIGTTSTQGALQLDGTAGDIQPVGSAAAAGSIGKAADAGHVHLTNFGNVFGTGADGAVTFDGITTVLGLAPSSSIYTMTRDIQCTSITINNGVTIKPTNFRIFCRGTITNNGIITNAGNNAVGGTAGASGASAAFGGGRAGGNGGTGVNGAGANGAPATFFNAGGNGGAGTSGAAGTGGAAAIGVTVMQATVLPSPYAVLTGIFGYFVAAQVVSPGAGGGGGGSDAASNAGGGGGGGGGVIALIAWNVINNGTLTVGGGNGANGTGGNAGGGGGGSGGLVVAYTLSAWTQSGTVTVSAGTKGTHSGSGSDGSNGGVGLSLNVVLV